MCYCVPVMRTLADSTAIYAGETLTVSVPVPTGTVSAEVRITGGAVVALAVDGAGNATGTISAAVTLALPAAVRWGVFATGADGSVSCAVSGTLSVAKLTSDYRAALAAVDAAIASFSSNPNRSITVGEIQITYKSLDDLLALRSYYAGLVAADEGTGADAAGKFARILTRF